MMNRRAFIGSVTATVLLHRLGSFARNHSLKTIGMQLYTVRRQLEKDFEGTLAKVAALGYKEVEFAGYFHHKPPEVKSILDRHGLKAPSTHIVMADLRNKLSQVLEDSHVIGHEYIVLPWIDEKDRHPLDNWKRIAEFMNQTAEKVHQSGFQFAYHNHNFEFENMDGKMPYDVLQENTDRKLVKFEMDLYWITRGHQDPLKYFDKYPGRFPLVHVKDMDKNSENYTEVGRGRIDFKRVFAQADKGGIKHYFVEQDETPGSPFDSLKISYDNLSKLQF
jgi:sugar phosphate isomerase/epimerase